MKIRKLNIDTLRGGLRRLNYARGRSSFPLISGDTYANLCDYIYSGDFQSLEKYFSKPRVSSSKLFLPAYLKDSFLVGLKKSSSDFTHVKLIIHNYDNIPNFHEMEFLSYNFQQVFSVNWLGDRNIATPIPIGLENRSFLRNGVPIDFLRLIEKGISNINQREINLLSSFSLKTNLEERTKALRFLEGFQDKFQMLEFTSPREYRNLLLNSKFVISPPGNGSDCHRTWEAIYLGAVPIVLRKSWPFPEIELPVLIVDDWSEIPGSIGAYKNENQLSIEDLKQIFLNPVTSE